MEVMKLKLKLKCLSRTAAILRIVTQLEAAHVETGTLRKTTILCVFDLSVDVHIATASNFRIIFTYCL